MNSSMIEQAIVGGLLKDNSRFLEVTNTIGIDDFSNDFYKRVFSVISTLINDNQPADVITVVAYDKSLNTADLADMAKNVNSTANLDYYAVKLREYADQRQFITLLAEATTKAEQQEQAPHEILATLSDAFDKKQASQKAKSNKFAFKSINDMKIQPVDWLIKGFMESDSLIELFGAPESGKSLMAIDWALRVASGIWWGNHKVNKGAVFYIAGEGHNGLARRFKAWSIDNNITLDNLPFYTSERAASLCSKESARSVERAINAIVEATDQQPRLVVVDTLARNFGGGNENSTEDMGSFVAHIDEHIRARFKTAVLLVHHTGHGASDRGRGSSSLKAAVDTEYCMKKEDNGVVNLSCTKMKDAEHPKPKAFNIQPIDLGMADEDGQPVNGVVLAETEYQEPVKKDNKQLGKNQQALLSVLAELIEQHREEFIRRGKSPEDAKVTMDLWREKSGLQKQRFIEARKKILERGLVEIETGGFVSLSFEGNEMRNELVTNCNEL